MNATAKRLYWVTLICTIAAIATHVYLTRHHYDFKYGGGSDGGICNISSTVNCDTTTASVYSEVAGIPVAIFGGLVNFAFLLLLLCWRFPLVRPETAQKLGGALKLIATGVFAVSLIMGSIAFFHLKSICPGCTLTYILSLVTLICTWLMVGKGPLFSSLDLKLYPAIGAGVILFAIFINQNRLASYNAGEQMEMVQLQFDQWQQSPARSVEAADPLVMNPNPKAKMQLVEFADFLCGHCASAFPVIKQFMSRHPDVQFSFQAWPLDGACNKVIPHSEGTRCLLARISHRAGEQGQPWKTQEWIFSNQRQLLSQEQVTSRLQEAAPGLGLDYQKIMACQDTDQARDAIRAQADLGAELGINGTPSLFVNGRKIPGGFSVPLLEKIYRSLH
jgi:protein-disulfide isomerase/uncharacterized membrane protein